MKLRVFTVFSGYDSQCLALDRLHRDFPHFDYELVGWSEIDKYAIQAHNALYPQWADRNFGDISKIDWSQVPDFDLFTYSSPCQDFSNAGQQRGGEEGSGTRSSLLWECRRAIIAKKPKYLLLENVAALLNSKHSKVFRRWDAELRQQGYFNYVALLNAKDYGVPQNRKRVFMLSRRDNVVYHFPKKMQLLELMEDRLESDIDECFYLSEKCRQGFISHSERKKSEGCGFKFQPTDGKKIANTITTMAGSRPTDNFIRVRQVGVLRESRWRCQPYRVYSADGLCPTIDTAQGEIVQRARGRNKGGEHILCPTITTQSFQENNFVYEDGDRIRKLTARECFRLMGVDDSDIDKIQAAGISNTRQYHLAGNSIVIDVLYYIIRQMFINDKDFEQ